MSQAPVLLQRSDSDSSLSLPPDVAKQLHVASLVFAGTTAVCIWDILHHLTADYHLFFKRKFRWSAAAYLASRIASLTYVLGFTFFATYPLEDCQAAIITFTTFYPLSIGSTSLLFFFRVRAVYGGHHLVTLIFGILWVFVLGSAITVPTLGSHAARIGSSCILTEVSQYAWLPGVALAINDTSVFLAISYRLLANTCTDYTPWERIQALFRGPNLHTFSKVVFKDGQKYYMVTVIFNLITIVMVMASSISPLYRGILPIPNIALTSIMACRVYRNATFHYAHVPRLSLSAINGTDSVRYSVGLGRDPPSSETGVPHSNTTADTKRDRVFHEPPKRTK
ncbi:hypothetical protein MVEN_00603100 [Mycena venus]|uniref:Transmembrane protein n=1 Tax=Mycena venus TaxID=2733690 RepID=A0A8H6YP12_9AGAR|nr:hypothetical protein MVEN_00603100 [Mycena venus]